MTHNIHNLVTKLIGDEHSWKLQLLNNWQRINGDLHPHVRLEHVKEDTLILGVYDASWLQELYLLSNVLLKTINRNLNTPRIKKLQFKQVVKTRKKINQHYDNKKIIPLVPNAYSRHVSKKLLQR